MPAASHRLLTVALTVLAILAAPACSSRPECAGDLTYALTGETTGCPACEAEIGYDPGLDEAPSERPARVLFLDQNRGWLILDVDSEAPAESLWPLLADRCEWASTSADMGISLDGAWLVFESERAICGDEPCVARARADDLSTVEALNTDTGYVRYTHGVAIDPSGEIVAIGGSTDSGATSQISLVHRWCSDWCTPEVISLDSPWPFNAFPHLSADGSQVAYACGPQEYGANEVCVQETDSAAPVLTVTLGDVVYEGAAATILGRPVFTPAGDWIFAADAGDETRIWRILAGGSTPEPIRPAYGNDAMPCTLSDSRVVSRWYGDGVLDEGLKIMDLDGDSAWTRDPGVDPSDIVAVHCGGG